MRPFTSRLCSLLFGLTATWFCQPVAAQEPVLLEAVEGERLGTASAMTTDRPGATREQEDDAENLSTYADLVAGTSAGTRYDGGFTRPYLVPEVGVDLGTADEPFHTLDWHSQLWLYTPDGVRDGFGASGRHALLATAELFPIGSLVLDAELEGSLAHGSDAERGVRRLDVGPAPYWDGRLQPSLWLTEGRTSSEEGKRYGSELGLVVDYAWRDTTYYSRRERTGLSSHGVSAALGFREVGHGRRGRIRFGSVGYRQHQVGEEGAPPSHQLDLSILEAEGQFGHDSAWGERLFTRSHLGVDVGWSLLWLRQAPFTHAPKMRLFVRHQDSEVGSVGGAVGHEMVFAPSGERVVGQTFSELEGRLASRLPDDFPAGISLSGRLDHLHHHGESELDAFVVRGDAEVFLRWADAELGADGTLGHGLPTSSMGWDLDPDVYRLWGTLGGFLRFRALP